MVMTEQAHPDITFYCVKCRKKQPIPEVQVVRESKPRSADLLRAMCPVCGTKMVTFAKRQGK